MSSAPQVSFDGDQAFERLVTSLYSAFEYNIGEIAVRGAAPVFDLDSARDTIAQMEMLLVKTYGNLTVSENALLTSYIEQAWKKFREKTRAEEQ